MAPIIDQDINTVVHKRISLGWLATKGWFSRDWSFLGEEMELDLKINKAVDATLVVTFMASYVPGKKTNQL